MATRVFCRAYEHLLLLSFLVPTSRSSRVCKDLPQPSEGHFTYSWPLRMDKDAWRRKHGPHT